MSKIYILEAAIAVHSVIIGFGYGALSSDHIESLKVLMIAFAFHQFFEGVSLGAAVAETSIDKLAWLKFSIVFATTFPVGCVIGILASSSSTSGEIVAGLADATASGVLVHTALVEMVAKDFDNEKLDHRPEVKILMYLSLIAGFSVMAVIAIWS
jgi:zinc transporter 1/2/3